MNIYLCNQCYFRWYFCCVKSLAYSINVLQIINGKPGIEKCVSEIAVITMEYILLGIGFNYLTRYYLPIGISSLRYFNTWSILTKCVHYWFRLLFILLYCSYYNGGQFGNPNTLPCRINMPDHIVGTRASISHFAPFFTRGQFWPSGIVVACVCLSVCPSIRLCVR